MVVVSVIIPVHNAEATIGAQLDSLATQVDAPPFEVVVVLNRCTDSSGAVAVSFADRLNLVVEEFNQSASAAAARNIGARVARGEYLLFCDADDRVDSRWVSEMVRPMREGSADLVGGKVLVDRSEIPAWMFDWRYAIVDGACLHIGDNELPFAMSATLGCKSYAFAQVGGFDEEFAGAGGEEVDLCARLLRAGYRIAGAPEATIRYTPRTTLRGSLRQVRGYRRGAALLAAKEGRLTPPMGRWRAATLTAKRFAYAVIKKRERPISPVALRSLSSWYGLRAEREQWAVDGGSRESTGREVVDFAVPPGIPLLDGLAFEAHPERARWYREEGIEPTVHAVMDCLLSEGDTFVDCGANIGVITVAAGLKVGATGTVIAFEPDPRTRATLQRNLVRHHLADRVHVRPEALGSARSRGRFNLYENDVVSGLHPAPAQSAPGAVIGVIDVDVATLDELVDGPVDMIKVDVEGNEPALFAGARGLLERSPNAVVLFEVNPAALRNGAASVDDLLGFFGPERWRLYLLQEVSAGDNSLACLSEIDREKQRFIAEAPPRWYGMALAVPHNRAGELSVAGFF